MRLKASAIYKAGFRVLFSLQTPNQKSFVSLEEGGALNLFMAAEAII